MPHNVEKKRKIAIKIIPLYRIKKHFVFSCHTDKKYMVYTLKTKYLNKIYRTQF